MTPGWKTSEFWMTLTVHMLNAFAMSGVLPDMHWAVMLVSAMSSCLVQYGYTTGRAKLKVKEKVDAKRK